MRKILLSLIILIFFSIVTLIIILSTIGFETNKFNKLITDKAVQAKNIDLNLKKITFKLDYKEFNLFLETQNPKINYRDILIPVQNVKVYVDFLSLLKSDPKIKKINLTLNEINISQLNKLSSIIKPSNFKSFLNNKIKSGKIFSDIEIFLDKKGSFENFIARGNIKDLNSELLGGLNLTNSNLSFFADKNDILMKNIFGDIEGIKISEGDIKVELNNGIKLNSNFNSKIKLNKKFFDKDIKIIKKLNLSDHIENFKGEFNNNFNIEFDNTYKVIDYNYSLSGKLEKSKIILNKILNNGLIEEELKEIYLSDLKIKTYFTPKKSEVNGEGKYSLNNINFSNIKLKNEIRDNLLNLKLNFDYKNNFYIDMINYQKPENSTANIVLDLIKKKK